MAIQIGKYKRPGIFIEEFDNSVITSPTVEGISSMVIGFSKKGPVNTPVLLQNTNDLESIFGSIDRNLERKGNFFHRTITKMLESSPVYAINLLLTDDNLDQIEYQTLSTATDVDNDTERLGAYRRFFDTTGFWKRDTDSFINLTKDNVGYDSRLLNFTNLSDRYITTFVFKTRMTGFDRTLIEWYGSVEKMPMYVNATDYASDYMVDVVVVGGDWSNYQQLSIDPRWSQYFNIDGLKKDQVYNFANDRNVTLLSFYEGLSLIPYFRDANGRNIFIETIINQDTDRTGLFCAFNADLFETDVPNGKVDLNGNNLVGLTNSSIDFLSYNDTIIEQLSFEKTLLDRAGNVTSINGGTFSAGGYGDDYRSAFYAEGFINGVEKLTNHTFATSSITFTYSVFNPTLGTNSVDAYAVMGGLEIAVSGTASFELLASDYATSGTFSSVIVLDTTGTITKYDNTTTSNTMPSVGSTDIVLGYITFYKGLSGFGTSSTTFTDVTIDTSGYVELSNGVDYTITDVSGDPNNAILEIEFLGTSVAPNNATYEERRRINAFFQLLTVVDSTNKAKVSMVINADMDKKSLSTMTIENIVMSNTSNKSLQIVTNLPSADLTDVISGNLLFYTVDDEFILGKGGVVTTESVYGNTATGLTYGIAAKYSDFYTTYFNGGISTDDFFVGTTQSVDYYLDMYIDNTNSNLIVSLVDSVGANIYVGDSGDSLDQYNTLNITSNISNYKQTIEIESPYTANSNKILVNASRYTELKVGDFLEAYVDPIATAAILLVNPYYVPKKLTRILSKKLYTANTSLVEISCDSQIAVVNYNGDLQTTRYTSIEDYVSTYKAISLQGFRIREASKPDGTEDRQNAILNLVAKGTPIFKAITNKEALDFRYLVDAFGLGLTERSKQQLVDICGERLDALGFINMPSMKSFKNSSSPSFVDADGVLQIEYVAEGGDPESNPAFLYSFGDGRGVTSVGYFAPYLTVNDNGRPFDVPPAMFVASTYMRKQITNVSSIVPWTIAAGTTNGRITGIASIEMDFTPSDIEYLNQAQMNPIVFKRNRGYIIETENTGQTLYKSALSYLHVREVLIELERELSRMLLDFQWKFNTADVRAEIKLRADIICEQYVNRKGLYNYFNKCDEENNTPDVIDNQIGVLDTYVEPIKAMGVIVNNVTILRTGAIQSGGFIS